VCVCVCVPWLLDMCDMTHSHAWHDYISYTYTYIYYTIYICIYIWLCVHMHHKKTTLRATTHQNIKKHTQNMNQHAQNKWPTHNSKKKRPKYAKICTKRKESTQKTNTSFFTIWCSDVLIDTSVLCTCVCYGDGVWVCDTHSLCLSDTHGNFPESVPETKFWRVRVEPRLCIRIC